MTQRLGIFAAAAVAASCLLLPGRAAACGGFFCNASQPVNQAAERIIFSQEADGTVTAVIQIQYQGPSETFAWMLPVAGTPEVGVSSNAAFQALQAATNPLYQLTTTVEGSCRDDAVRSPSPSGIADAGAVAFDAGAPPPVTVVDEGAVGPYDYVVISVDPSVTDPASVAVEWLQTNGYDVNDFGSDRLTPYLEGGMNLLAFRLTKGNDTGSIRPVRIGFGRGAPSIPIRPTAVAANDDMGVMVWVLGPSRAVPVNYMSLELNEALINWINPNANYNDVVIRAANEAGGQGFVTEMATPATTFAETIFPSWMGEEWQRISSQDWTGREGELLLTVLSSYGALDGMREALAANLPLPDGVELDALLACVSCYYDVSVMDIDGFEPAAFLLSVHTDVIEPLELTGELFERSPYMTRLYTTMSADEMTRDPMFDFNSDLGDYSNVHNADRVIECSPSIRRSEAPWRVTLPNGDVVRGNGATWPADTDDETMPANSRILRVGTEGTGEVVEDNGEVIADWLAAHNETVPPPPPPASHGLCSMTPFAGSAGLGAMLGVAALGLLVAARRRRR